MKEIDIINTITKEIGNKYLGDDCAFLKDLGIVVSQDSLVENIHFKRNWCSAYQLGYKSIAVSISDILASGAEPKYVTIALSLPNDINENYIKDFYSGAKSALYGAEIVGGDITGSKTDIMVSVTAIGSIKGKNISSRSLAKEGYAVITKGNHGSSSSGLLELQKGGNNLELIKAHLEPKLEYDFSKQISTIVEEDYAMMDTSDGLADALYKIAEASNVKIMVDYTKVPHLDNIEKEQVLFGGEDYKLVAAIPNKYVSKIDGAVVIGRVEAFDGARLEIAGKEYSSYDELNVYNHFGELS